MIGMAGILLFLFMGFNYAFFSQDGMVNTIWDNANETLSGVHKTRFDNTVVLLRQGFGVGCVLCFILSIVFFVADALRNPRGGVNY